MIDYQCVTLQDLDEVEALYRKYLDNGSSLRERIDKIFSKNSTYSCKAVDTDTGKIVGIAVYESGLILSCGHHEICEKIYDEIGKDAIIYTGESLLVEKDNLQEDAVASQAVRLVSAYLSSILKPNVYISAPINVRPLDANSFYCPLSPSSKESG